MGRIEQLERNTKVKSRTNCCEQVKQNSKNSSKPPSKMPAKLQSRGEKKAGKSEGHRREA